MQTVIHVSPRDDEDINVQVPTGSNLSLGGIISNTNKIESTNSTINIFNTNDNSDNNNNNTNNNNKKVNNLKFSGAIMNSFTPTVSFSRKSKSTKKNSSVFKCLLSVRFILIFSIAFLVIFLTGCLFGVASFR